AASDLSFCLFLLDSAITVPYPLSLHDALPISLKEVDKGNVDCMVVDLVLPGRDGLSLIEEIKSTPRFRDLPVIVYTGKDLSSGRSEEHTSELQSLTNLVCRLLLEKKKSSIRMT